MKEYRIQCYNVERYGDKWVNCAPNRIYKSKDEALAMAAELTERGKQTKEVYYYKTPITEFRVVCREVGEWAAI